MPTLRIGTCSPSSKPPCIKCPDATACKLPYWKPRHCCFVSPKARQCNWSSDTIHRKVRHFLPCGFPPRQDLYPTSVATARATPSSHPSEALQQRCVALLDSEDDQSRIQGQKECNNDAYDKLPETVNFHVPDGYVSFTRTFCYLGSLLNYSRRNDDNITAWIASATAAMGALKDVWRNPHLDIYTKYLLF